MTSITLTSFYNLKETKSELIYGEDVRESLRKLPSNNFHCVVTSPPYWGLRHYLSDDNPLVDSEIGREESPHDYVRNMVDVFREVRRVLRDDGVLWVNIGDSYAQAKGHGHWTSQKAKGDEHGQKASKRWASVGANDFGLKPKDLCGIPWRLAFALQDDGWWLRQDVIWEKPAPMPEPVSDRCTRSHEYIFMFAKSRYYYYDAEAIKEPVAESTKRDTRIGKVKIRDVGAASRDFGGGTSASRRNATNAVGSLDVRNKRSVWRLKSQPYTGSHFAVFPQALPETCILAGTSEKGCCHDCGTPWVRIVEEFGGRDWRNDKMKPKGIPGEMMGEGSNKRGQSSTPLNDTKQRITTGWKPACDCPEQDPVPCRILDPFSGSATTGMVANKLGRDYVGLDLNESYLELAQRRIRDMPAVTSESLKDADDILSLMTS